MSPKNVTAPVKVSQGEATAETPTPTAAAETAAETLATFAWEYVGYTRKGETLTALQVLTAGTAVAGGVKIAAFAKAVFAEMTETAENDPTYAPASFKTVSNVVGQNVKAYAFANVLGLTHVSSVLANAMMIATGRVKSQDADMTHAEYLTAEFDAFVTLTDSLEEAETVVAFARFVRRMLTAPVKVETEETETETEETEETETETADTLAATLAAVATINENLALLTLDGRKEVLAGLAAILANA